MIPQLVGIAVFGVITAWTKTIGEESGAAERRSQEPKRPPRSYPTPDEPLNTDLNSKDTPIRPPVPDNEPRENRTQVDPVEAIKRLSDDLCRQLMACPDIPHPRIWHDCIETLLEDKYIATAFGISPSLTLREVRDDNGMGYTADAESFEQCLEGIRNISCEQFEKTPSGDQEAKAEQSFLTDVRMPLGTEETGRCESIFRPEPVSCDEADLSDSISSPGIQTLLSQLCGEVATCNPGLACDVCIEGALATHRFADRIGMNRLSLQAIDFGIGTGLYHFNEQNLAQCLEDVKAHSCFRTAGAWDSEHPKGFSGIHNIIPKDSESCAKLIEKPKESCSSGSGDPLTQFAESMCGAVVTCRPEIPCDHCVDEVMKSDLIAAELGAETVATSGRSRNDSKEISGLNQARRLIEQGHIHLDQAALEQCANDIDEQTCIKIQLGRGDYNPKGYRSLVRGIKGLLTGGSGSCQMALYDPADRYAK